MLFESKRLSQFLCFSLSLLVVASAQPDWSVWGCILASSSGYALFWKGMLFSESKKSRFCLAFFWFALVEGFHLNWFLADRYVGFYIYPFLIVLLLGLGAQFGVISLLIHNPREMRIVEMLGISGGWTLFEWSRLFLLSGFSWDPVGLQLTGTLLGMQMSSIFGLYGLTFWIFFTNLLALRLFSKLRWRQAPLWIIVTGAPYLFGLAHFSFHSRLMQLDQRPSLNALLVQTSLIPEQRVSVNGSRPLPPLDQWDRILTLLSPYIHKSIDLIVLPEGVVPFGADFPIYPKETVFQTFKNFFENSDLLPAGGKRKVGNRFWSQGLANATKADVIIGLDDVDFNPADHSFTAYNAAFIFHPFAGPADRYEKQILVPMGEYIPFNWCKKILSKYGISDSFTPGLGAKVFQAGPVQAGLSICYEETYGNLMRANRKKGAEILVNLTNDVWYPRSRLPIVHLAHGRVRAVEMGLPLLRACNTGVTCGIDSLGRIVDRLPHECSRNACSPGVLPIELPLYRYTTLYMLVGDMLVIGVSIILFGVNLIRPLYKPSILLFIFKECN